MSAAAPLIRLRVGESPGPPVPGSRPAGHESANQPGNPAIVTTGSACGVAHWPSRLHCGHHWPCGMPLIATVVVPVPTRAEGPESVVHWYSQWDCPGHCQCPPAPPTSGPTTGTTASGRTSVSSDSVSEPLPGHCHSLPLPLAVLPVALRLGVGGLRRTRTRRDKFKFDPQK
jgi:hypothetical protein